MRCLTLLVAVGCSQKTPSAKERSAEPPPPISAVDASVDASTIDAPLSAEAQLAQLLTPFVVQVVCQAPLARGEAKPWHLGSGYIDPNGMVITAEHVYSECVEANGGVAPALFGIQVLRGSTYEFVNATVKVSEPIVDVAMLTPATSLVGGLAMGDDDVAMGTKVLRIGFPAVEQILPPTHDMYTVGQRAIIGYKGEAERTLLSPAVLDGHSGGPIIDIATKRVVGIVSGVYTPHDRSQPPLGAMVRVGLMRAFFDKGKPKPSLRPKKSKSK